MEFGPRALGSRSILADARDPAMQSTINRKVKFREGFRPFAPIVLREHAHEYFGLKPDQESPYMLVVAPVADDKRVDTPEGAASRGIEALGVKRSIVPSVTHVDGSARVQTVDAERSPLLHRLMSAFHAKTGCPVMVNTSFNLGWEPIVQSPREAYATFMSSDIDLLCLGPFLVRKSAQPATVAVAAGEPPADWLDAHLVSPCCEAELSREDGALACAACGHRFAITDGIPRLYWPHEGIDDGRDVTEIVKEFYEKTPFPNYEEHDSVRSLLEKSRRGLYARRLDESIPYNSTVLEVGCGTGQLSNFLGVSCRRVVGTDVCLESLRLGEEFRTRHGLDRVRFVQMNLFRPSVPRERFDVVISSGVLHHTSDPFRGYEIVSRLVKPGGHVVLGLYNRWGRLMTDARRRLFRLTGGRGRWIDPMVRATGTGTARGRAWFADQYRHPHESKHTFDEVLGWFERTGFEFVRGVPALRPEDDGLEGASLFEPQPEGTSLEHRLVQGMQVLAPGQREGGLFVMIGRRPDRAR
jgi:SAM-dependent methyltransferase